MKNILFNVVLFPIKLAGWIISIILSTILLAIAVPIVIVFGIFLYNIFILTITTVIIYAGKIINLW